MVVVEEDSMADSVTPRAETASTPASRVTRRQVLGGIAGVAGLAAAPSLIAACSSPGASSPAASSAGSSTAPSGSAAAAGSVTLGSNYSDEVPKKVLQGIVDTFTKNTGIAVKVNTVAHGPFQDQISSYLQATPDDVFTWFSGYRMRFFAAKGLATDISDVWSKLGTHYAEAFKVGSTGDDGKQYFVPIYLYPWAVFYRKSVFSDNGWTPPKDWAGFIDLGKKIQNKGLTAFSFADQDGWPAQGTFDILNLRINGYDFHVGLMAGKQKWTDAKVQAVFQKWKELLPFYQSGFAGRKWQDASQALVDKKTGMYFHGMFLSQQFQTAGQSTLDDLDFFPFPALGTQYDAENALDAPIDGFMISANSPSKDKDLDASKAFVEYLGQPATQVVWVTGDKSNIAAAKDADTSAYTPLQKKAAEVIGSAQRITQFLDRDTRPDFAGKNAMQTFLLDWLQKPDQDLSAFLGRVQGAWDALPPLT
jgi:multiple sugar transport system substrate-binding protein